MRVIVLMVFGVAAAAAATGARRYRRHDENGIHEFAHGAVVSAMRRLKRASHFDVKYDEFGIPMYKFQDGATLQFVSAGNSTSGQQEFRPILQPGNDKRAAAQRYDGSANTVQSTGGGNDRVALVQVQPFVLNNGNGGDAYVFGASPQPVNMYHQTPPPYPPSPSLVPPVESSPQSYALPPPPPYAAPPPPSQPYAPVPAPVLEPNTMLGYALKPSQPATKVAHTCTPNSRVCMFVLNCMDSQ
jgi:hypothetical protein